MKFLIDIILEVGFLRIGNWIWLFSMEIILFGSEDVRDLWLLNVYYFVVFDGCGVFL